MFGLFSPKQPATPVVEAPQLAPEKGAKMTVFSNDRVDIIVGRNGKTRTWKLHKDLLSQHSNYFDTAIKTNSEEASTGKFSLENEDPAVFALFVNWLYSDAKNISIGGSDNELNSNDPWVMHAERAYKLGELLQAPNFSRFAFVKFAQGIRFANPTMLLDIFHAGENESKCHIKEDSPVRRFTGAWLWYLRHTHALLWTINTWWVGDGDLADPVCGPLVKRMRKDSIFGGRSGLHDKACDPHWLGVEHWYSSCSSNPLPHNCSHVPFPCNMDCWGLKKN